ncbi:MAG: yoeB, toxin YoeB [Ignavibacteria bacterium]|nr:yoeB, toxin YoeB [Ignavibacteria bacterium]
MGDLNFDINAIEDILGWIGNNKKIVIKILKMIMQLEKEPFTGIGKPEPLKHELSGCWSRRIDAENRLVYQVTNSKIKILQCRFHY